MELPLLHEANICIAQPATEGRDGAAVSSEGVAVVVLPKDALRNVSAPAGSHVGQTTQLLDKAAAKTFDEDHENIGTLRGEQGVLNVVGWLRIEPMD